MAAPKQIPALVRFWMVLTYEYMKSLNIDNVDAYNQAMGDTEYEPIDTRFCMIYSWDGGWMLLEASGSVIVRCVEAGGMTAIEEKSK